MAARPDWWGLDDSGQMLVRAGDLLSVRKLRLLACACCRATGLLAGEPYCREAIEVAERYADGEAPAVELEAVRQAVRAGEGGAGLARAWLLEAVTEACGRFDRPLDEAHAAIDHAARAYREATRQEHWAAARRVQARLLEDLAHQPPPLPASASGWLRWGGGTVATLARSIYLEHSFRDLPVLGDALEEAGCDDAELLAHCRSPGRHARGCWALDALLGAEGGSASVRPRPGRPKGR
jgi:hypothetical protein